MVSLLFIGSISKIAERFPKHHEHGSLDEGCGQFCCIKSVYKEFGSFSILVLNLGFLRQESGNQNLPEIGIRGSEIDPDIVMGSVSDKGQEFDPLRLQ